VKEQRARDEQAVSIATALGVFLGALGLGILLLLAIGWRSGMEQVLEVGFPWAAALAGLAGVAWLVRHR
jgi:hypothetical protein